MAIPEKQLETWSHQGSVSQSSDTYNTIKNVLQGNSVPYANKDYSIFLQGSYGNDTNIYAESDVDIVIKLNDCFRSDVKGLSQEEVSLYDDAFLKASYNHTDFKRDVLNVLAKQYGSNVKDGHKAIAITAQGNRRKADVIVAIQFRCYYKFRDIYDQSYSEGICFYDSKGTEIINYPKQHSANLTQKHQDTNKWLKPMIRVLKNLRSKLVDENHIGQSIAPSYYIEGLLYNIPSDKFKTSFQDCFINSMNWIQNESNKNDLVCANEHYYLLRDNSPVCWSPSNCQNFVNSAIDLWNKW